jgi:hypothetical protein
MPKRCPNGSRRNKKTKQCVRKSAMGKKKRCPKGSRRNRKTKECVRKSAMKKRLTKAQKSFLNTIRESPGSVKSGVVSGVKTMETLGQSAVKTLPSFSKKNGGKRAPNRWNRLVKNTFKNGKKKNKKYSFRQALRDSKKLYKRGG